MKNKLLLSVVASALLTTSAFAVEAGQGELNLGTTGNGSMTVEYKDKHGSILSNTIGTIDYKANILGSGSVSDALIRLDLTDTNLSSTTLADIDAGFAVGPTVLKDEDNVTIATYDKKIVTGTAPNERTYFLFNGDATTSIVDGIHYRFATENNNSSTITYGLKGTLTTGTIKLDVYSTSGTEDLRDSTEKDILTTETKQFTTSCITKFDGLINIESLQDSFVNTAHDNASAVETTDGLSQWDTLVFTVDNQNAGQSLDGNASAITMQTRDADGINVDNNFGNVAIWNAQVVAVQQNGTSNTYALAHDTTNLTTQLALNNATPALTAIQGNIHYTTDGNLTFILPNTSIPAGLTTYYVGLNHTTTAGGIKPVNFVNGRFALEAGMADNNNTIYPAGNTPRGAAQDAGKWMDHAYIAQIAGASSTKNADATSGMQTKLFIVNRSCKTVTPVIKLIKGGAILPLTGIAAIEKDNQGFYDIGAILDTMNSGSADAFDYSQYALEVTLPGIAENFYMYAQAKNKTLGQFKDLPVYNTSERD